MARKKAVKLTPLVKADFEEKANRNYEMIIVFDPQLSEERLEKRIEEAQHLIEEAGGSLIHTEHWGTRKLAYPIRHLSEGSYVLQRFEAPPELPRALESRFNLTEDILRYLFVKLD